MMWLKVKIDLRYELINTKRISKVCVVENIVYINFQFQEHSKFVFDTDEQALDWFNGFELAMQGLDFIMDFEDDFSPDYIKPLFASKNEALYRYMMQKEYLGEVRND